MRIAILSPTPEQLMPFIDTDIDEIVLLNEKITLQFCRDNHVQFLISYNYRHIIQKDVLDYLFSNSINLHTSYLPFNRGSHPVLWSVLEDTPLGVSIHQIDQGLDTGPLLVQKRIISFNPNLTLRQLHYQVNQELIFLFSQNWENIRNGKYEPVPQNNQGAFHKKTDSDDFLSLLDKSWDTPIFEAKQAYVNYLNGELL
jgi:methionyl-tRNA formyltransferase